MLFQGICIEIAATKHEKVARKGHSRAKMFIFARRNKFPVNLVAAWKELRGRLCIILRKDS